MTVLGTLVVTLLLTVLLCGLGVLLTVAPFVTGVDMAERRGYSTERWGAVCLAAIGAGAALGLWVKTSDSSRVLWLLAAALTWAGPAVLSLLAPGQRVGGPQGAHEH